MISDRSAVQDKPEANAKTITADGLPRTGNITNYEKNPAGAD